LPSSSSSLPCFSRETEESKEGGAPWDPGFQSTAAAGERGKRERRARGFDSRPHLGLGRLVEGGPQQRAEVASGGSGGGAAA